MIEIRNLSYRYADDDHPALDDISLDIERGEILAVVGHNGSGKSTLAKHFNALLIPSSGTFTVDGMLTTDEDCTLLIRQKIGMVFQNPDNQIVTTVVEEDVGFGPENLGVPTDEILSRVHDALLAVGMTEYARSAPHMLSGGQKQRIAIAGMLAMHPEVLVLDEATSMLDPQGRRDVLGIVKRLNEDQGMTVIMITQFMEEALLADRVAVLHEGRLAALGSPRAVFSDGDKLRSFGLDLPAMAQLRDRLIYHETDIRGDILTIEEMANALCPLLLQT